MLLIALENNSSTPKVNNDKITVAIVTTIVED
jgi:hypothetical protein